MKYILCSLLLFTGFVAFGQDNEESYGVGNWQCPKGKMTPNEFVEKNEDIIRVMMYAGGSSEGNYLIVDSLKGKYPINHQFQMEFNKDFPVTADQRENFNVVYWGVPKVDYEKEIVGDRKNCLLATEIKKIKDELIVWKKNHLSSFDLAVESSDLSKIEKLISAKQFKDKIGKIRFDTIEKLLDMSPTLAIKAFDNGFPIEEPNGSALISAVWRGQVDVVKYLISKKANLNFAVKKNGFSPLFVAVGTDNDEIVKLLLDAGASAKPVGPIFQNPLCNIGGVSRLKGSVFKSNTKNMTKIAELLLQNGADPNVSCNVADSTKPIQRLDDYDFHAVWDLLFKHGLKKDSFSKYQMPEVQWYFYKKGIKPDNETKTEIESYLSLIKRLSSKDVTDAEVARVFSQSIQYGDLETFKSTVSRMKVFNVNVHREGTKNVVDCSTRYLDRAGSEFTKILKEKGFQLNSKCEKGNPTEPNSIILSFISSCRYDLLSLADASDVKGLEVSNEMIDRLFDHWDFSPVNAHFRCIETARVLTEKNVHIDKNHLFRKILEVNSPSLLDYGLKSGLVSNVQIQNALEIYSKENSLLPETSGFESKAISEETFSYVKKLANNSGIESKEKITKKLPKFVFLKGSRYPICSIGSESPAYKRKRETIPFYTIPACSEITKENLVYFEVYDITDDWLVLIAIVDTVKSHGALNLGSKIYVKPSVIGTPFFLSDGVMRVPLSKAGLKTVRVKNNKFAAEGIEDICKGIDSPKMNKKDEVSDGEFLPEGFKVENMRLENSLGRKIKNVCS